MEEKWCDFYHSPGSQTIGKKIFSKYFLFQEMSLKKGIFHQFLVSKNYDKIWHFFNIFCNFCVSEKFNMSPVLIVVCSFISPFYCSLFIVLDHINTPVCYLGIPVTYLDSTSSVKSSVFSLFEQFECDKYYHFLLFTSYFYLSALLHIWTSFLVNEPLCISCLDCKDRCVQAFRCISCKASQQWCSQLLSGGCVPPLPLSWAVLTPLCFRQCYRHSLPTLSEDKDIGQCLQMLPSHNALSHWQVLWGWWWWWEEEKGRRSTDTQSLYVLNSFSQSLAQFELIKWLCQPMSIVRVRNIHFSINTVIKGLGANSQLLGAMLVEVAG